MKMTNRFKDIDRVIEYIENFIIMEALCDKEYFIKHHDHENFYLIKLFTQNKNDYYHYKVDHKEIMNINITKDIRFIEEDRYIYKIYNWNQFDWSRKIRKFVYEHRINLNADYSFNLYGTHDTLLKYLSFIWR